MSTYTKDQISASRRVYGNPYAHIELLEEEVSKEPAYVAAHSKEIRTSRELLQNQYAHLDGEGKYRGLVKASENHRSSKTADTSWYADVQPISAPRAIKPRKYSDKEIKRMARNVQVSLWKQRDELWGGTPPSDPIEVLDPSLALHLGGYSLEYIEGFGPLIKDQDIAEIAGYMDTTRKKVYISGQFTLEEQLFTAAHELGHTLLHRESLGRLHRDRPSDGAKLSRDYVERAADKFAVYFLMPENLVKDRFSKQFRTGRFAVTEESAFGLGFQNMDKLKEQAQSKRKLARLLAGTTSYHDNHFKSLASQFRVSVGAMAIRLEELGLIDV